jgi:hypothetical protein
VSGCSHPDTVLKRLDFPLASNLCYLRAMSGTVCSLCQKPQAQDTCGLCAGAVCRKCREKVAAGHFVYWGKLPVELSHTLYCGRCFDSVVAPKMQEYDTQVVLAKDVFVFHRGQGEETRHMKRTEVPLRVSGLTDRTDALMRLAFAAVQAGFNTLVDVDIKPEKVRSASGYQTTHWNGSGIPTNADGAAIHKREAGRASC